MIFYNQQLNCLTLAVLPRGMAQIPIEDTEPRVQQLFDGSYLERDMESQDSAGAGLCVYGS